MPSYLPHGATSSHCEEEEFLWVQPWLPACLPSAHQVQPWLTSMPALCPPGPALATSMPALYPPGPALPNQHACPLSSSHVRHRHSLRVKLVKSSVHTHSDLEVLQPLVFSSLLHDGCQACAAELGSPPRHGPTHLLHHNAVFARAVQAQLLQDLPDLQEGQPVTVDKQGRTLGAASCTWTRLI